MRLLGALLVERNAARASPRAGSRTLEAIPPVSDNTPVKLSAVAACASRPYPPDTAMDTKLSHHSGRHDPTLPMLGYWCFCVKGGTTCWRDSFEDIHPPVATEARPVGSGREPGRSTSLRLRVGSAAGRSARRRPAPAGRARCMLRPIRASSLATAVLLVLAACGSGPEGSPRGIAPLFHELAEESGLRFRHFGGSTGQYFLPEIMGAGVALLDFDLDGDLDVYLLQGDALSEHGEAGNPRVSPNGKLGNRLFENRIRPDGALAFADATASSGLGFRDVAMGVAVGDYDGDRYPDIYLTNFGPNRLLRNRGDGSFIEIEGPQDTRWSTSATFFDYDSDSDLDLFFANFVDFSRPNNKQCFSETGERDYCIPTVYRPVPGPSLPQRGRTLCRCHASGGTGRRVRKRSWRGSSRSGRRRNDGPVRHQRHDREPDVDQSR